MAERDTTVTAHGVPPVRQADGSDGGVLGFTAQPRGSKEQMTAVPVSGPAEPTEEVVSPADQAQDTASSQGEQGENGLVDGASHAPASEPAASPGPADEDGRAPNAPDSETPADVTERDDASAAGAASDEAPDEAGPAETAPAETAPAEAAATDAAPTDAAPTDAGTSESPATPDGEPAVSGPDMDPTDPRPTAASLLSSATELRVALDELRRVLDVDELSTPTRRRRGPWLLLGLLVLALIAGLAIREGVLDRFDSVPGTTSANPSASPGILPSTGPTAGRPTPSPSAQPRTSAPATQGTLPAQSVQAPATMPRSGPGITTPGTDVTAAIGSDEAATTMDVYEQVIFPAPGLDALPLSQPSLTPLLGDVATLRPQVSDIQVELDGQVARAVPAGEGTWVAVPPQGGRFTKARLRYSMSEAVARSTPSLPGRALVVVTPLTGSETLRDGLPLSVRFSSPVIQGVSCPTAPLTDSLCATRDGDTWTARLPSSATSAIVLAQVNLNPPS
jgi:hypothetical protein